MKRNVLTEAVRRAALEAGYAFHTGPENCIAARGRDMPSIWMIPPKLTSHEGRRECRDTYSVILYFMAACGGASTEDDGQVLCSMESDAIRLSSKLVEDDYISRVAGIKCTHTGTSFTRNGETVLQAEITAELSYRIK